MTGSAFLGHSKSSKRDPMSRSDRNDLFLIPAADNTDFEKPTAMSG
jgi:hypothetical protein